MTFKNVNIEEVQVHPLFTVDEDSDDDEIKTVTTIHVARKENGKLMFAPRMRNAAELTSLEQIQVEFGGGEYVLIGYNNGRISARKTICLPGKSKPMFDEGIEPPAPAVQHAQAPVDPMQAMMGGQGSGFMPLIMLMMQQQQQAADRQMQMFLAMMENTRSSSAEDKAAARAEMQANVERERINSERMIGLMQSAMASKPSGDSSAGFTQGVEFMRGFAQMQIEQIKNVSKGDDTDWGSLIETLGTAVQMFGVARGGVPGVPSGLPEGITEVAEAAQ